MLFLECGSLILAVHIIWHAIILDKVYAPIGVYENI